MTSGSGTLATGITDIAAKFTGMRRFQRDHRFLVGRETEMLVLQVAIIARLHPLLFGPPGVAKSMTTDGILRHLPTLAQFKTQAYKASPPEQFLGPISLKQMEQDRFVRIVDNKLPDCEIAYIDELTRAPRAILPAFQGLMVEREFDAGLGVQPAPLMSLIGSVNHIPDDPELEAFLDRFALKLVVQPPASQQQFGEIMRGALSLRATGEPAIPDELCVSRAELAALQEFVATVRVPDSILDAFGELWSNLLGVGVQPSIRRYVDLTKAMQTLAALDGRDEVIVDDMQIAQHSLWSQPDEREAVYAEVVKFASAWVKEKASLIADFQDTLDRLGQVQALVAGGADATQHATIDEKDASITDHAIKVVNAQRKLGKLVEKHIGDAGGRDTTDLDAVLVQIDAGKQWVQSRILGGLSL